MRDRIKERFLQSLGLAGELRGTAFFQRILFVDEKCKLRRKRVEQFALLQRWWIGHAHGEHTFGAIARDQRNMQRSRVRKRVGGSSGGLFFLKRPDGDAFIFARWRECTGPMAGKTVFISQPNRRISLESFFDQRQNFRQSFIEIAAGSERAYETVKRCGAFLAPALRLFAFAQFCREVTDDKRDNEIRAEHQEVVKMGDVKGEAWRNEQKIPKQRAERGEKQGRPSAQSGGGENDCEQIEKRNGPVTGVIEDRQG